jgi:hypothetical protein
VRTGGFGLLALFTLDNTDELWYPFQAMLFTFPEYCALTIYVLVFLTWFESVLFAHSQFFITSRSSFRKYTRVVFFAFCGVIYATVCVLYIMLCTDANSFQNFVSSLIERSCAILNASLAALVIMSALYIHFIRLSGFTLVSPIARELVSKASYAFILWCFGRAVRAVVFFVSIAYAWQQTLDSNTLSIAVVSILVVTELVPILYLLDWTLICVLLIGEEVAEAHTQDNLVYHGDDADATSIEALSEPLASAARGATAWLDIARVKLPRSLYAHAALPLPPSVGLPPHPACTPTVAGPQVLLDTGVWCTATGITELALGPGAEPGSKVLVKRYRLDGLSEGSVRELAMEVMERSAQAKLPSAAPAPGSLAQMFGVSVSGHTVYLVSRFYPRRSVFDLCAQASRDLAPAAIVRLAAQVAAAMARLHAQGFVHAHLKSRNVLLDDALQAVVSDHAVRYIKTYAEVMHGGRFHTAWTAPEVLMGLAPSKASDVYSFGVLCWELMYRRAPWPELDADALTTKVGREGARLPLPSQTDLRDAQELAAREGRPHSVVPASFVLLCARCFLAPELRPSFSDIGQALSRTAKDLGFELPAQGV